MAELEAKWAALAITETIEIATIKAAVILPSAERIAELEAKLAALEFA